MTTTGISSWAVDLAEVGAIYPFQGLELIMLLIGLVAWIWWHVWSIRHEQTKHASKIAQHGSTEQIKNGIDSG